MELSEMIEKLTDLKCKDTELLSFLKECVEKKYKLSKEFNDMVVANTILLIDMLEKERKEEYIAKDNELEEEEMKSKWEYLVEGRNKTDEEVINDISEGNFPDKSLYKQAKSLKEDIKELKTKYIEVSKQKPKVPVFNEALFREEVNKMFSILNTANELKAFEMEIRNIAKNQKIPMKDLKGKIDRDLIASIRKLKA